VTTQEFFEAIAQLSGLVFVVTSMLAMGMSLTVAQIVDPLRNVRLVVLALIANFVLVPALAFGIAAVIPIDDSLRTGLIVLAAAGGAPFLPKLVQVAHGPIALGVGLMVLLMVVTIAYLPIVLPLLLPGVEVDPGAIAQSLVVLMLVPLAIGLLIRANAADVAAEYGPLFTKGSSLAIVVLMVVGVGLSARNILGLLGTGGIVALLVFVLGSFAIGTILGGRDQGVRGVLGLGTAQRNVSAALVVAAQNFGPDTLTFVLVGAIVMLLILMPVARRLGASIAGPVAPAPANNGSVAGTTVP
jgi:BASS family bile acid:Na+ symporter